MLAFGFSLEYWPACHLLSNFIPDCQTLPQIRHPSSRFCFLSRPGGKAIVQRLDVSPPRVAIVNGGVRVSFSSRSLKRTKPKAAH